MKNIFPDCTQTVRSGRFLPRNKICARTDPNFAAGRDGWVLPNGKMPSGLYADGTFRKDFLPRNKICAQTSYNFAAGRDGWVIPSGKMSSGLYADGTFREVFVSEQDMGHPDRS